MRVNPSYYTYYRTVNTGPGISVAPTSGNSSAPLTVGNYKPTETLVASKPRNTINTGPSSINNPTPQGTATNNTAPSTQVANYGLADWINNRLVGYKQNQASGNTYINSSLNNNDWNSLFNQFASGRQNNMNSSATDQDKFFTDWFNRGKSGGWW